MTKKRRPHNKKIKKFTSFEVITNYKRKKGVTMLDNVLKPTKKKSRNGIFIKDHNDTSLMPNRDILIGIFFNRERRIFL